MLCEWRPVIRLMAMVIANVPKKTETSAWPMAIRRDGLEECVVSFALWAIPIVRRRMRSRCRPGLRPGQSRRDGRCSACRT